MPIVTDWGKRIMAALACIAVLSAVGLGWWANGLRLENKQLTASLAERTVELEATQLLREQDQATARSHARRVAQMTTIQKATDARLYHALEQNAAWAGQRVPDDVADALGLQRTTP